MKNQLEIINPQDFRIDVKQAGELTNNLTQIKKEREVLENQYSEIIKLDIENIETSKKARELRLLIQKNRTTGINNWHKTTKDFFLKGGQFVDAIKRMEVAVNERMESQLQEIEKYQEIKEQKRLDLLETKRLDLLEPYKEFVPFGANIRNISDDDFTKLLNGAKLQFNANIEAERKAEAERLEIERLNKLEQTRKFEIAPYTQFISESPLLREMNENDYLLFLNSLKDAKKNYEIEQEKIRLENEKLKAEAEAKAKALELERKEQMEREAKLKAEAEANLKAEREAKAKLEAELKAKKDAEIKAENERKEAELKAKAEAEAKAKAPIKKQLSIWVDGFSIAEINVENEKKALIKEKFEGFKKWAKNEIENL